jgi:hypothetical protein
MPMLVHLRVSEYGLDALLESFGDEVFRTLGLLMHLFNQVPIAIPKYSV